jgi:hypothetical protein
MRVHGGGRCELQARRPTLIVMEHRACQPGSLEGLRRDALYATRIPLDARRARRADVTPYPLVKKLTQAPTGSAHRYARRPPSRARWCRRISSRASVARSGTGSNPALPKPLSSLSPDATFP